MSYFQFVPHDGRAFHSVDYFRFNPGWIYEEADLPADRHGFREIPVQPRGSLLSSRSFDDLKSALKTLIGWLNELRSKKYQWDYPLLRPDDKPPVALQELVKRWQAEVDSAWHDCRKNDNQKSSSKSAPPPENALDLTHAIKWFEQAVFQTGNLDGGTN